MGKQAIKSGHETVLTEHKRQFDYESDKIIGSEVAVDFTIDGELAKQFLEEFNAPYEADARYTIISRNGDDYICKVADETVMGKDADGKPVLVNKTNILKEVYCLSDIRDRDKIKEVNNVVLFDDYLKKSKHKRSKHLVISTLAILGTVCITGFFLFLMLLYTGTIKL